MKLGIFGYPKVGKTTLFNLMTQMQASVDKFSTGRAAPNIGSARVSDPRVDTLVEMYKPKKTTRASVQYVDVAGVAKGDLSGSPDTSALRPVDAILHVVRAFDDGEIEHGPGEIDPLRDIRSIEEDLLLTDFITIESRLEKVELDLSKKKDEKLSRERDTLVKVKTLLDSGAPVRSGELTEDDWVILRGFQLLTAKPILHVVNLGEERQEMRDNVIERFKLAEIADHDQTAITYVLGKLEMEISQLDEADAKDFLDDLGLTEPGIDRVIRTSYAALGLISFFTVGEDEVRAWTIRRGTAAENAADVIHSDIKRGFIRAEVMGYDDLIEKGSDKAVKDAGLFRLEGRSYVVEDGEIVHFRFNV